MRIVCLLVSLGLLLGRSFGRSTEAALAEHAAGLVMADARDGSEMVLVPAGTFTMGSTNGYADERPMNAVRTGAFWIDRCPVTNAQFARFLNETGGRLRDGDGNDLIAEDSRFRLSRTGNQWRPRRGAEDYPVVMVTWYGARAYAVWSGKRLPTEAEWEKAARGTDGRAYPWGSVWDPSRCNCFEAGPRCVLPVGSYARGASPYGCLDMAGNVWEWTSSLIRPYPYRPEDGRESPASEDMRVVRGGSCFLDDRARCRTSFRGYRDPWHAEGYVGFRCVRTWAPGDDARSVPAHVRAFPGAEGFGAYARGGRGGRVLFVDNRNDAGPGSLRAAVEAEGPRIVVFRVSGNIFLKSRLDIWNPYITIAGQSAPGDGICLCNFGAQIRGHDVILRYLRIRPGDTAHEEVDGLWISGGRNVIVDHCSAGWAIDEDFSTTRASDYVTVQWCMITEALHNSYHSKGNHGYGGLVNGEHLSYHHDLWAHNRSRNPRPDTGLLDFRNNVIYNWNGKAGYGGGDGLMMNYVSNYLKPGPWTRSHRDMALWMDRKTRLYASGNVIEGFPAKERDNRLMVEQHPGETNETRAFPVEPVATDTARVALTRVLNDAGATLPRRDSVDARVAASVRAGTGRLIDSQRDVGGWPEMRSAVAPVDTDGDGIPDAWETAHGLNPRDASDASRIGPDGYTYIEGYLNDLARSPRR